MVVSPKKCTIFYDFGSFAFVFVGNMTGKVKQNCITPQQGGTIWRGELDNEDRIRYCKV